MKSHKIIQLIILTAFILTGSMVHSQSIKGIVLSQGENKKEPLDAAIVKWINTTKGTITDEKGNFELTLLGIVDKRLVVTYTGFKKDTIEVGDK
ncbi:MAG: carboxypeptidase-like regulatory domain-containing protein, partial [Ignavibacteria bacterium]|nr:carboxypeptidase-like regulatory domain-containing protein [Ignavibacteria bacterium]